MEHSKTPSVLSTTEINVSNKAKNLDNNTDAEEWKPGTSLIVGDWLLALEKRIYQETEIVNI